MTDLLCGHRQGFGAMGLTAFYGAACSNAHGVAVMTSAHAAGCRLFDTAQIYQQFTPEIPAETCRYNEELVGRFLRTLSKNQRDDIIVATKFYPRRERFRAGAFVYSFELLLKETDASLARLGVDCIDLYYLHRMYPEDVVDMETLAKDMASCRPWGRSEGTGCLRPAPNRSDARTPRFPCRRCSRSGACLRAISRRRWCRPAKSSALLSWPTRPLRAACSEAR